MSDDVRTRSRGNRGASRHAGDLMWVPAGPKAGAARRFSEDEVRAIRSAPEPDRVLAERLGVSTQCVRGIRRGHNYAWVI